MGREESVERALDWKDFLPEDHYFGKDWTLGRLLQELDRCKGEFYNVDLRRDAAEDFKPAKEKIEWYGDAINKIYLAFDHLHADLVRKEELVRGFKGLSEVLEDGN